MIRHADAAAMTTPAAPSPVTPSIATSGFGLPVVYLVDDEEIVREALAWLVAQQAELHGGTASLEDSPLGGTRLALRLPGPR